MICAPLMISTIDTPQTIDVSKIVQIMEDIPIDIGKHFFNIKYTLNLGQLMQIVFDIKKILSKKPKLITITKVPMVVLILFNQLFPLHQPFLLLML